MRFNNRTLLILNTKLIEIVFHPESSARKITVQAGIPCTGTGDHGIVVILLFWKVYSVDLLKIRHIDLPEELSPVQGINGIGKAQRNPVDFLLRDFIFRQNKPEFENTQICRYLYIIDTVVINNRITSGQETNKKYPDNSVQFHG